MLRSRLQKLVKESYISGVDNMAPHIKKSSYFLFLFYLTIVISYFAEGKKITEFKVQYIL